jgi:N-acetylmuramoyl-L-alanine amidase
MEDIRLKYPIIQQYIPAFSLRRSCQPIDKVVFVVAHDTGNEGSTALQNVSYYVRTCNGDSGDPKWQNASAHIFVDDKNIIECVPALTGSPEKAWHVQRSVNNDNLLYGCDANDAAIGVEYCFGQRINSDEAYKRYVWVIARLCFEFSLDAKKAICGHFILDPARRHDPVNGLSYSRRSYDQLLIDINQEVGLFNGNPVKQHKLIADAGEKTTSVRLNIRKGSPDTRADVVETVAAGKKLLHIGYVKDGMSINGNSKWFKNQEGNYFWAGGVC